jgi:hypothetical protein
MPAEEQQPNRQSSVCPKRYKFHFLLPLPLDEGTLRQEGGGGLKGREMPLPIRFFNIPAFFSLHFLGVQIIPPKD